MTVRKNSTSYNTKKKHNNNKETNMDGSKSTGMEGRYCSSIRKHANITRREALPEEASIHTIEMTAMKELKEREDIRWVIYKLVELNAGHREKQKIIQY